MKCDNCQNYHVNGSGTNDGYYTACVSREFDPLLSVKELRDKIHSIMDEKTNYCPCFQKL